VSVLLSELGPPHSLSRKRVCPSPGTKGEGKSQFRRLEKKPSTLSALWDEPTLASQFEWSVNTLKIETRLQSSQNMSEYAFS
jgi:hypothetical protein